MQKKTKSSIPPQTLYIYIAISYTRGTLFNTSRYRLNHQITAPEVRVLDEKGENVGVMSKNKALELAVEKGLDLIEVAPLAKPPVARIMSFDKFRYEAEKKLKEERAKQKNRDPKQVQISVRAAKNDLALKARKVDEFLEEGYPVVIAMTLRGREKGNKDWAKMKMEEFKKIIVTPYKQISPIQWGGRGFSIMIAKQ